MKTLNVKVEGGMSVVCNNVPRKMKYGYEVPEKFKSDFDYIDADEFDHHDFIEYKGQWFDVSEFMRIEKSIAPHCQRPNWERFDGYSSDSYFSGLLVKFVDDESVIVARYYC